MSEFKTIMIDYVRQGSTDDMERLADMIDHLFCHLKENDPEMYHKYITKIKLVNKHLEWDKPQAECSVHKMKNKDGSEGPHWTYEQTTEVLHNKGLDYNEAEWFYVLNMAYSDHYYEKFDTDAYIRLARDIIDDMDVLPNSTKRTYIAKHYE
jgi:hypothetical protein